MNLSIIYTKTLLQIKDNYWYYDTAWCLWSLRTCSNCSSQKGALSYDKTHIITILHQNKLMGVLKQYYTMPYSLNPIVIVLSSIWLYWNSDMTWTEANNSKQQCNFYDEEYLSTPYFVSFITVCNLMRRTNRCQFQPSIP